MEGPGELFNGNFQGFHLCLEPVLFSFQSGDSLAEFFRASGELPDFPLAVERPRGGLLLAPSRNHARGVEDFPVEGDQSFPDGVAVPEGDRLGQIGYDPHVSEKVLGEVNELSLHFDHIQEGDDRPFGSGAVRGEKGVLFHLERNEAGPAGTFRFQVFDGFQAFFMVLNDEMLELFAQHRFDYAFVLGVGFNDVLHHSADPVLSCSLGLALQQDGPDPW